MEELDTTILQGMQNLKVLDVSNNNMLSLDGVQYLARLKRFICQNNMIADLTHLNDLVMLVEIDMQGNQLESSQ